jgi:hypothetical protein
MPRCRVTMHDAYFNLHFLSKSLYFVLLSCYYCFQVSLFQRVIPMFDMIASVHMLYIRLRATNSTMSYILDSNSYVIVHIVINLWRLPARYCRWCRFSIFACDSAGRIYLSSGSQPAVTLLPYFTYRTCLNHQGDIIHLIPVYG